jgi:hypothetical protein
MTRTPKIRTLVAGLATAAACMAAAGPADASIGTMSASLSITPNQTSYQSVKVQGLVKMPQSEAQDLINRGYNVTFRLWGSDTFSDDFLFGPSPSSLTATSQGLAYQGSAVVRSSLLNEDWGQDEVYAGARLVTSYGYVNNKPREGTTVRSARSNEISRSF